MPNSNKSVPALNGQRLDAPIQGDCEDAGPPPSPLAEAVTDYLEWSLIANYSERTIAGRAFYLRRFCTWAEEHGVLRPRDVDLTLLEKYQAHLFRHQTRTGAPLGVRSQYLHLHALRMLFRWTVRQGRTSSDPAQDLVLPRLDQRLPGDVFTHAEAEAVLRQPNLLDPLGLRDRAILEVLYSTAIRRTELTKLTIWDLDRALGTLLVRQGKGRKDRVVPIGDRAATWVDRYQALVRPILMHRFGEQALFLTKRGGPIVPAQLSALVSAYITAAGVGKQGSCHLFRHTCATLMLEGGADIRFIQEMLGHASLASTQIYTRVSIRKLKEIHTATHPAAAASADPRMVMPAASVDNPHASSEGPHLTAGWKRPYLVAVGRHLRELRKRRGLSRENLAGRASTTRGHIRKLEEGVHPPRPSMVAKLARALAVDSTDLVPSQPTSGALHSSDDGAATSSGERNLSRDGMVRGSRLAATVSFDDDLNPT
jgi:integrase/recombinase XerD